MHLRHLAGLWLLTALAAYGQSPKQSQKPPAQPDTTQSWQTKCTPATCFLSLNLLRGLSGDPPNPNNPADYIAIAVGINMQNKSPAVMIFQVTPSAEASHALTLTFSHAASSPRLPGTQPDQDGAIPLPFQRCDQSTCTAIAPNAQATKDGKPIDLLARFLTAPQFTLLYTSNNHEYKTTIALPQFRKEYAKVLHENPATTTDPQ